MTVSTVTAPPVPDGFVITAEPSAAISAIGKPTRAMPSSSPAKLKLPPVACAPHSMT